MELLQLVHFLIVCLRHANLQKNFAVKLLHKVKGQSDLIDRQAVPVPIRPLERCIIHQLNKEVLFGHGSESLWQERSVKHDPVAFVFVARLIERVHIGRDH